MQLGLGPFRDWLWHVISALGSRVFVDFGIGSLCRL